MEEGPENGKESLPSAHANGIKECTVMFIHIHLSNSQLISPSKFYAVDDMPILHYIYIGVTFFSQEIVQDVDASNPYQYLILDPSKLCNDL